MITVLKWNALFSLSLLLSWFLAAGATPAAASSSEVEVELEAELDKSCPTCTEVPKLKGEVEFEQEFSQDGLTLKEAKIKAQIKIPIPNPLGIDASNAATALVVLELSNVDPNAPYATCDLAFKKVSGKGNGTKATYELRVQTKLKGATHVPGKKQAGNCTLDAIDLNVQPADTAMITANGFDVLSGVFGGEEDDD